MADTIRAERRASFRSTAPGWTAALAAAAVVVLPLTVLGPAEIYARNTGEFSVALGEIFTRLLPVAVAATALMAVLVRLLPAGVRTWAVGLGLALGAALYVQAHLLAWEYGQFDGTGIDWESHRWHGLVDLAAWSLLIVTGLAARHWICRHAMLLAGALLGIQAASASVTLYDGDVDWWQRSDKNVTAEAFELSPRRNALVIVLDAFKTPIFERVVERNPELASRFTGFTFFRDATSVLSTTWMSIPAMLTGEVYHNERPAGEYLDDVFARRSVVSRLEEAGLRTDLITLDRYCARLQADSCLTPSEVVNADRSTLRFVESLRVSDLVLFRYLPNAAKQRIYSDEQMLLTGWLAPVREGINWHLSESLEVVRLMSERLHVGDERKGAFKFVHLMVPHHPYHLDRRCNALPPEKRDDDAGGALFLEQGECAVRLTVQLIEKLKELGVYDQTAVIVVADHGYAKRRYYPNARVFARRGLDRALPLLLVKPPGAGGPMRRSTAPATNADVARTVAALLGVSSELPGRNVMALPEDAPRTRRYYHYVWRGGWWGKDYLPPVQEYILRGDPREPRSWREGEKFPPKGKALQSLNRQ